MKEREIDQYERIFVFVSKLSPQIICNDLSVIGRLSFCCSGDVKHVLVCNISENIINISLCHNASYFDRNSTKTLYQYFYNFYDFETDITFFREKHT